MQTYRNEGGKSGIRGYEVGDQFINVKFEDGQVYKYTYQSAGKTNVEHAKKLAQSGQGLHSFIVRRINHNYLQKWRA